MTVPESIEEVNKSESRLWVGLVVFSKKNVNKLPLRVKKPCLQGFAYCGDRGVGL